MKIRNWEDFQHYKDRSPPWIKLHKSLLDNYKFQCLPLASRALAPMLWLLASEQVDGDFDGDPAILAFRLRRSEKEIMDGLKPLIERGFVIDDSMALAVRKHLAIPETEREAEKEKEAEKETEISRTSALGVDAKFDAFWQAYPKKTGKGAARKAWSKVKPDLVIALKALEWQKQSDQWRKDGGQYIPNPATWLNQGRWEDAPLEAGAVVSKQRPWFITGWNAIVAKGVEAGIVEGRDLAGPSLKAAIFKHYGIAPEQVQSAMRDWNCK